MDNLTLNNRYYTSCPRLDDDSDLETGLSQLTLSYNPYHCRRTSSVDGSETATEISSSSGSSDRPTSEGSSDWGPLNDHERLQFHTFFRGLKTQIFVCRTMANLYFKSTLHGEDWKLSSTGVPIVILDTGEARSRQKRGIQIMLAERGTCFTLWRDTIDNLSSYQVITPTFHTMHLSSDHTQLAGLSFDCEFSANELWHFIEQLISSPENISLSVPKKTRKKKTKTSSKPAPLPPKSQISQPCCFQHVISIDAGDKTKYQSMKSLVSINKLPTSLNF